MFSVLRTGALLAVLFQPAVALDFVDAFAGGVQEAIPSAGYVAGAGVDAALPPAPGAGVLPAAASGEFRTLERAISRGFTLMLRTADVLLDKSGVSAALGR